MLVVIRSTFSSSESLRFLVNRVSSSLRICSKRTFQFLNSRRNDHFFRPVIKFQNSFTNDFSHSAEQIQDDGVSASSALERIESIE